MEHYFRSLNLFSDHEINDLVNKLTQRQINKSEYFIQEGETCKEIAFIQEGIFRSFYTLSDGTENTYCFRFPNNFMTPYSAYITGTPSKESMQAITNASLMVIKKSDIEQLADKNINWQTFLKQTAEQEYLELENRFFQFQKDNATQRYLSLLKNNPEYIQQITLQYLASYLGVTQRHLSRIRKEITF